uniref:OTU domain-containing protein n=1 Tax=Timspurckia oligopyrenoides TaxID=708627 RepID=A0A7S0ZJM2_9RHOD|mmetsp:Transcript_7891/g.14311  ORF Transcript_7891/g.14311 Transcript_7891/m.14311 type:complete len:265 (+) Transcript_7891:308-1102(+)|eukprot:CAMPEP_0182446854 /NCGR_PEP_ID=MMETSP1172-20130603/7581_1 /TAXON_ID=708627 /ORGANISM="Timspurckia oligopyrenoides, Strain CCMP3278" /LENGTH=264 /DNA_ID=CAMNT_0024642991 /DNA_START=239 /DNA_END=1033 /DNA_ORIENTATION=+
MAIVDSQKKSSGDGFVTKVGDGLKRGFSRAKVRPAKELGTNMDTTVYDFRDDCVRKYNSNIEALGKKAKTATQCSVELEDDQGRPLRFIPIASNGNCGFIAICAGIRYVQAKAITSADLRVMLRDEVLNNREFYRQEAKTNEAFRYCRKACGTDAFCRSVVKSGSTGHWLGEKWGYMEMKALARALKVCIEMFVYDEELKLIRSFQKLDHGRDHIGLLFSGPSDGGHFDVLLLSQYCEKSRTSTDSILSTSTVTDGGRSFENLS